MEYYAPAIAFLVFSFIFAMVKLLDYLKYKRSIHDKALISNFRIDLSRLSAYFDKNEEHKPCKDWFSPSKKIYPVMLAGIDDIRLIFARELMGHSCSYCECLMASLSDLNLYTEIINSYISHIENIIANNTVLACELDYELNKIGIQNKSVDYEKLNQKFEKLKSKKPEVYKLGRMIHYNYSRIHNLLNKDMGIAFFYIYEAFGQPCRVMKDD